MVSYLKKNPACHLLLIEKTDRLYRNFKDYLTIDELGVEVHFVKENVILSKNSRSHEKFMHGIKLLMAKNYIDNLSEEVQKGLHNVNTMSAAGKRINTPDPFSGP
jgi:site-specific DNA recombinase